MSFECPGAFRLQLDGCGVLSGETHLGGIKRFEAQSGEPADVLAQHPPRPPVGRLRAVLDLMLFLPPLAQRRQDQPEHPQAHGDCRDRSRPELYPAPLLFLLRLDKLGHGLPLLEPLAPKHRPRVHNPAVYHMADLPDRVRPALRPIHV